MSKSFLISTSVAAIVAAFVFTAGVSSASARGDNDQYGHASQSDWDKGGGYANYSGHHPKRYSRNHYPKRYSRNHYPKHYSRNHYSKRYSRNPYNSYASFGSYGGYGNYGGHYPKL